MSGVLNEEVLSAFFHVQPEYDSGNDSDWKEFFANVHFRVFRDPVSLIFSYSENFGDVQLMMLLGDEVLLSLAILRPRDVRISDKLRVFISHTNYLEVTVDPKISVSIVTHGDER